VLWRQAQVRSVDLAVFFFALFTSIQPLMTLLFSNFIQAFVDFGVALINAKNGVPGAAEQVPAATSSLKHTAVMNAIRIVYIGKPPACTVILIYLISVRHRNFRLHLHFYVDMGLYGRSQRKTYSRKIFKSCSQTGSCLLR